MKEINKELIIAEYLDGNISDERMNLLQEMIQRGEVDPDEFLEIRRLHEELGSLPVPEPTPELSESFYSMLEKEKEKEKEKVKTENRNVPGRLFSNVSAYLERFQVLNPGTATIALTALLIGLLAGSRIGSPDQSHIELLGTEIQQMRQVMMLSMLDNPSAVERIQAVNIGSQITSADDQVIEALFTTLDTDTNINVRQQVIDVLLRWGDRPAVRLGLLEAIDRQEHPLVLIALADAMTYLNERRSVDKFRRLLEENTYDIAVQQKLENSITELS